MKQNRGSTCQGKGSHGNDHAWGERMKGPRGITIRRCLRTGCAIWRTERAVYQGKWQGR